jgi:hypothetical protein
VGSPSTVLVSNQHTPEPVADRRTPEQRAAVFEIMARPDFDFACSNPFDPDVDPNYAGPFMFIWYTIDGQLHFRRIGKRGKTLWASPAE